MKKLLIICTIIIIIIVTCTSRAFSGRSVRNISTTTHQVSTLSSIITSDNNQDLQNNSASAINITLNGSGKSFERELIEEHDSIKANRRYFTDFGKPQQAELTLPEKAPVINPQLIQGKGSYATFARANPNSFFIHGFKNYKVVALTFDDGPDDVLTPKFLDYLRDEGIKVTFFFMGSRVDSYPDVVRRAYMEGHLIVSHSYTHPELAKCSDEKVQEELTKTEESLYKLIGRRPAFVRPPFGSFNQRTIDIAKKMDYKAILWSFDSQDWASKDKNKIVSNVMRNVTNNDIILMHMAGDMNCTLDAVPEIVSKLKEKGYKFERVDELLGIKGYK